MNSDLKVARQAAEQGAEVVRQFRGKGFGIRYKGKNDLVTDADVATEKEIVRVIRAHFPDDAILAEESADAGALPEGRVWIIDPIDGTTNFAYGFPIYCVSVALWSDGEPLAATVIEVNRHELYTAVRGEGARLNGHPLRVSDDPDPGRALVATGFPYNDYSLMEEYIALFRRLMDDVQGLRRAGSATFDLCCVAAGRFQGFYEYGLKPWDVAAAALLIREAGGVVTDWKGGRDWLFGERIVAGSPGVHRFLRTRIDENIGGEHLAGKASG